MSESITFLPVLHGFCGQDYSMLNATSPVDTSLEVIISICLTHDISDTVVFFSFLSWLAGFSTLSKILAVNDIHILFQNHFSEAENFTASLR